MTVKPRLLALSASLRNGRWGGGISRLVEDIEGLATSEALFGFLSEEGRIHLGHFVEAGREAGLPFDELYRNLRKNRGDAGLSNSEVGMAAGLWGALQVGCDVDYVPLSDHFGRSSHVGGDFGGLRQKLLECDGIIISTPVYFGDRSSLLSDFIEAIRRDEELLACLRGKPAVGIAVGAKRNGGQETALIYQILEFCELGMIGLGNDSETTAQYGGTIVAGDIGQAPKDSYGLQTAIGCGRRIGRIMAKLKHSEESQLAGPLRVMFWILQDAEGYARNQVEQLLASTPGDIDSNVMDLCQSEVGPCIACDICPITVGPDIEYRCIIKKRTDAFFKAHKAMLDFDLIVPVTYSPRRREHLSNHYQRFIERTRYMRRGDYMFSDVAVMPLVFEDVGATEQMHVRLFSSLIRHHTAALKPAIGYVHHGEVLNPSDITDSWNNAVTQARCLAAGRLSASLGHDSRTAYNPVGYILSAEKAKDITVQARQNMLHTDRELRNQNDAAARLTRK